MIKPSLQRQHIIRRVFWAMVALVGIILAIRLAAWQGNKADSKMHVMRLYAKRQHLPAQTVSVNQLKSWAKQEPDVWRLLMVNLTAVPYQQPVYQWVAHKGQWGRCMYGVLETGEGFGVLAKLGWWPDALSSPALAAWPKQFGQYAKQHEMSNWQGQLQFPEKRLALKQESLIKAGYEIESVDVQALEKAYKLVLFPGVLELESQPEGCESMMPSDAAIQKHRSYQYQWYALAVLMGVLYGIYGYRQRSI